MNYRHLYHAGNFADVTKHLILLSVAKSMLNKPKPFCYLDTHAGVGRYDLTSASSQKRHEYLGGAAKLFKLSDAPAEVVTYLQILKDLNPQTLTLYPGSPYLISQLLRAEDRMVLCELHREDVLTLKQVFAAHKQVSTHHIDGYHGLKAFLPPKEGRGLVLIDPPFEQADEFDQIIKGLSQALTRFAHGIYLIWYPIKDIHHVQGFKRKLQALKLNNVLTAELAIDEINPMLPLSGSGLAIINAPWQIEHTIQNTLSWLWPLLANQARGYHEVTWLCPPQ